MNDAKCAWGWGGRQGSPYRAGGLGDAGEAVCLCGKGLTGRGGVGLSRGANRRNKAIFRVWCRNWRLLLNLACCTGKERAGVCYCRRCTHKALLGWLLLQPVQTGLRSSKPRDRILALRGFPASSQFRGVLSFSCCSRPAKNFLSTKEMVL